MPANTGIVWSTTTSNAAYTFSTDGLTATRSSGSGGLVRATVGQSGTGDWSYTIVPTAGGQLGLANATESTNPSFLGGTANSVGWNWGDSLIYINGVSVGTAGTNWTAGDTIIIRLKNNKLYISKNGTYILGDPVAETGGVDVSALGVLYPAATPSGTPAVYVSDFTNWSTAAATTTTVTITFGSMTYSGQPITVNAQKDIIVSFGTMTYTGQTIKVNKSIPVTFGTMVYTAQAIAVSASKIIIHGTMTYGGQAVSVIQTSIHTISNSTMAYIGRDVIVNAVLAPVTWLRGLGLGERWRK